MALKIGILGSGIVARTLAKGFLENGSEVMMGTRDAGKLEEWISKLNKPVKIGSMKDAAAFGSTLVLATKGTASEDIVKSCSSLLEGKIVIDTTNPIAESPPNNGVIKFFTSQGESLMERLQQIQPKAHFVKAFNSVGNAQMINPKFKEGKPTMFIAGNNSDAKVEVTKILESFGWETEDMGLAGSAGAIEQLCILWCIPGFLRNQWSHAFKILR